MAKIEIIEVKNQQVTSVEPGDFEGLENLMQLYLQDNKIASLDVRGFEGSGSASGTLDL